MQGQRRSHQLATPDVDYSPWTPIEAVDYPLEAKTNRVRSIEALAPEPVVVSRASTLRSRNNKLRVNEEPKGPRSRPFAASQETVEQKPEEKPATTRSTYKRRTSTAATTSNQDKPLKIASRVKVTRKLVQGDSSTTSRPRRKFTAQSTSNNVLVTTSEQPTPTKASLKKIPFTRGNFRPNKTSEKVVDGNASGEENYPEHFKLLLKNKETGEDKALKKPVKPFRPSPSSKPTSRPTSKPTSKTTKSPAKVASKTNTASPVRPRVFARASTTTTEASLSAESAPITTRRSFRRPRPTERTKLNVGSTLQEPPTARSTPGYATRSPKQVVIEEPVNVNTQADETKQIDPPLREYFPRTSAVSFKTETG